MKLLMSSYSQEEPDADYSSSGCRCQQRLLGIAAYSLALTEL